MYQPVLDEADEPTVTLSWVRRQLGRTKYGERRIIAYLSLLIDQQGFPPPLPELNLVRDGSAAHTLTSEVRATSIWPRKAVLAWLDDYLPPANAAQVDEMARRDAAADMDSAAGTLRVVQGGRA
ncbi:MAG: hypothetical protein B7Y88_13765 [Sphingomonadales bacterium 32-64-17]|nr:MAG: hypothetical protein B7Y88_13765 [Sphingomonadales bacterium 32-64-17]